MGDIQTALDAIRRKLPQCQQFINYYDGNHKLAFASTKFETAFGQTVKNMRDNLCPIVVDATADRMEVLNFSGDNPDKKSAIADAAWEIWQRETLDLISNDVHKDAIKCGEGYLIVWPDETNEAKFYVQDPRQCAVIEDEDTARKLFGAKQWVTADKWVRLTLYYQDRIDKYISRKKWDASMAGITLDEKQFKPLVGVEGETANTPNPYDTIPVFKFKTTPLLADAIPMQDMLNKTLADRMVAQEFGAFPQRWAVGLEPPKNEYGQAEAPFKAGVDRLWVTTDNAVKFGEFSAAQLDPFLKAANDDRLAIARVTGTPLHFFGLTGHDVPSGEALKTLEARFTKRIKRLSLNFGTVWSNAMKLALMMENNAADQQIAAQWESPEQRSEKEIVEVALLKEELGVPAEVLFEEIGYTKEDIAKFDAMTPDPAVINAQRMPNETQTNQRIPQAATNGAGN
jgi:hypothetical protein